MNAELLPGLAARQGLGEVGVVGCGSTAAHGDVRGPNVLVRKTEGGGSAPEVRIIDFDWWVRARVGEVDGMRVPYACL